MQSARWRDRLPQGLARFRSCARTPLLPIVWMRDRALRLNDLFVMWLCMTATTRPDE